MEGTTHFQCETVYDLPVHKEFTKGYLYANIPRCLLQLLFGLLLLLYSMVFSDSLVLTLVICLSLLWLLTHFLRSRGKGDIRYKRQLLANNSNPLHVVIRLDQDAIHYINRDNGNQLTYRYDQFRSLIETDHLLILTMQYRLCLILDKRWLKGGSPDDLTDFLFDRCDHLKGQLRTTAFGIWAYRIAAIMIALAVLTAAARLWGLPVNVSNHSVMTYREIAAELEPLGITINEQTLSELDAYESDDSLYVYGDYNKALELLCYEGMGQYDYDTWEWTPSASGVYWFDAEVMYVDSIYSDFLQGVSAMAPNELDFTNILEDYSHADIESGTGTVSFSFDWQSKSYYLEAEYVYDWFDTSILEQLCQIIGENGSGKELFYSFDGGQGFLLYYGDPDTAAQLEKIVGFYFTDSFYSFP